MGRLFAEQQDAQKNRHRHAEGVYRGSVQSRQLMVQKGVLEG